jgi:membrane glycosyltransferase
MHTDVESLLTASSPRMRPAVPAPGSNARIFLFYFLAVLLTGSGSWLFADLLWRTGWSSSRTALLILFSILLFLASVGFVHAIFGLLFHRRDSRRITASPNFRDRSIDDASIALIFPIYNENVKRVCAGLQAMHQSLEATGHLASFDFFLLSDSDDPGKWVDEERSWSRMARDLSAFGRIYYRRRLENEGKKSGNVRDFLNVWGKRYRYFMVLDADSIMTGKTVVDLVKLMEANPTAGLIQTAPVLVNARSAFGRMQQFANRLYGPLFTAGFAYWAQDGGNYWGHNAIIRTEPFMKYCDLPKLPGKRPFGGQILSHDFVEAALLRKANWEVWFAWDLDGSYEEGPPGIIDNAQRDRRWCQGNLQHFMVLFSKGLRGISRLHLTLGILGYLAGPLWLLFMAISTYLLWYRANSGLSEIVVHAFTPFLRLTEAQHGALVFGLVMTILLTPKALSIAHLAFDPDRRRQFGGLGRATAGVLIETAFSTLHAPLQMLLYTKFVCSTLFGFEIHWGTQRRAADGTPWELALREHWMHTLIGAAWGALVWWLAPQVLGWFIPVLAGMALSIPLSVWSSRESVGQALRHARLFLTPEETAPVPELEYLQSLLPTSEGAPGAIASDQNLRDAVLDPYLNAVHVTLLQEQQLYPHPGAPFRTENSAGVSQLLGEQLLIKGPDSLTRLEKLSLLLDADTMAWLHREAWLRSVQDLAPWWCHGFESFGKDENDDRRIA